MFYESTNQSIGISISSLSANQIMLSSVLRLQKRFLASQAVSTSLIKELRQITGAPILDCKNALKSEETNGDLNLAVEWLRKKGISVAAKKQDRAANEGLVGLLERDNCIGVVELRSETDFVARNENFQTFLKEALETVISAKTDNLEVLMKSQVDEKRSLNDSYLDLISRMNEKIEISSCHFQPISLDEEISFSYLHAPLNSYAGSKAAILSITINNYNNLSVENKAEVEKVGKDLALQVIGGSCQFLNELSDEMRINEYEIEKQALLQASEGKKQLSEEKLKKKVDKKLKQLEKEVVLLNQSLITNPKMTVRQVIKDLEKRTKTKVELKDFKKFEI